MESLKHLLIVYCAVVLFNIVVLSSLWISCRVNFYRDLLLAWIGSIPLLLISALTAHQSLFARAIAFCSAFPFSFGMAYTLARLSGTPPRSKQLSIFFAGATAVALALGALKAPHWLPALAVAVAIAAPSLYVSLHVIFKKWDGVSVPIKGYTVVLLCAGLHTLDYPISYASPELLAGGFTAGFVMVIAYTLFGTGAVLERITNEKIRLELELEFKAKLTQSAKLAAIGEMASGVAHEINNPLAVIRASSDMLAELLKRPDVDGKLLEKLSMKISGMVIRIAKIVSGLQRLSHGQADANFERERIFKIVEDVLDFCRARFRQQGIELFVEEVPHSIEINCRPVEISQIILNLLNNAKDAVLGLDEKWVRIATRSVRGKVELSVTDSGFGIEPAILDKLFQPFFTTKEVGKGTGLGLSISRSIAQAHGGNLYVDESSINTKFVLVLPLKVARAEKIA